MSLNKPQQVFKVLHLFCGIGGGAVGFSQATDEFRGIQGQFRNLAGIDVDPLACQDYEMLTKSPAFCMDLFERRDYVAFHGQEPPVDWKEVTPEDIRAVTKGEYPDVVFLSPPCKGLSGLLPEQSAKSEKYQALNRLVVRGIFLVLEAFGDNLPAAILLENVPRIKTRGKSLLNTISGMLKSYGYAVNKADHDCGEIGGLGQHRKRFLLMARNQVKMSSFIYTPEKQRVKSIGEIIGPLPLPDAPGMGRMHRLPRLQWKTWVRLALIPAGGDWRDLEKIAPEEYRLEYVPRGSGPFGVQDWDKPANTVIGRASVRGSNGVAAVADPRLKPRESRHAAVYQVLPFDEPANTVTGTRFGSGAPAIADTRTNFRANTHHSIYRISQWAEPANTVTGANRPNNGAISITDPRIKEAAKLSPQPISSAGLGCKPRSGTMGVQDWNEPSKTVIGSGDIHASATAVADPRLPKDNERLDPPPIIISLDGTWHRPLTTLELAALQSFPVIIDGKPLELAGNSDARWREAVGNAVPPKAAKAIAHVALRALLVSQANTWELSSNELWVIPENKDSQIIRVS